MRLKAGGPAGFTLIEVLIALVVLLIASMGLLSTILTVINTNNFNKRRVTATTLAQDKLEELKNLPYDPLSAGEYQDPDNPLTAEGKPGTSLNPGSYLREWKVDPPDAGTKTVTVTVRWGTGDLQKVQFVTVKAP